MEGERRVLCITCRKPVLCDRNQHILTRAYLEDNSGFTEYVIERINIHEKHEQESSLYAFLGRIRLNIALDALRSVRCVARSTEHRSITQALLHDAIFTHPRRSELAGISLLRTYNPPLDDQNVTGQNMKVISIRPKCKDQGHGFCSCSLGKDSSCGPECVYKRDKAVYGADSHVHKLK